MAYSELVKNFGRIRDYMRQFYVYGFKSRSGYDRSSARSYDNERRRIESWLGGHMGFRNTAEGKRVFLSVDSRSIPANPLHSAFKSRSFTDGDVNFHFFVLDLLQDGEARTAGQVVEELSRRYPGRWEPDLSTIRRKLREYADLGCLTAEKRGRELVYRLTEEKLPLVGWDDALAFYSEADPMGVIGAFLRDRQEAPSDRFRFKHHYLLHTLDAQVMLPLLEAIGARRSVRLTNFSPRGQGKEMLHWVCPLHIWASTQDGRQYLMCYHYSFKKMMCFRLDYIQSVEAWTEEPEFEKLLQRCQAFRSHLWGTSGGPGRQIDHFEMIIRCGPGEDFIPRRLEREKRTGTVEQLSEGRWRFTADVYDALELIPWVRTFIGRIERIECSNPALLERWRESLAEMAAMYGGGGNGIP